MLSRLLTDSQLALVTDERRLLARLQVALAESGATAPIQETLARSIAQLDELFLLVVVGEFNAGKSAFINALLGRVVLPEGVTPTTTDVTLVRHGGAPGEVLLEPHLRAIDAPLDLLRELHVVDTPGTNAILREHETITAAYVPRSDLVLFVTSADRPFTETERAFLERIRDWGKKVIVVINKIDILERPEDVEQLVRFVAQNSLKLLGLTPEIFPVSARLAMRAKAGEAGLWPGSRFEALETHLREKLDESSRLRLKLLNPLGVARQLATQTVSTVEARLANLQGDFTMLDDVDRQLQAYESDMAAEYRLRMAEIDNILLGLERRGHDFFDDLMRIGRVFDLVNRSRIQQGFEEQVIGQAPQQIERKVNELVDWMVDADFRQWQNVTAYLADRQRAYRDRIVAGHDVSVFPSDRARLIDTVGREAQRVVDTYDRRREASALADGARNAVAAAAAMGAGALGLGTIVSLAASSAAADVTGFVAASLVAALGLFVIPARRRRAKRDLREKITALRESLMMALRAQFDGELARSGRRIREAIAPYARFVRAEGDRLRQTGDTFRAVGRDIEAIKVRIDDL
jgi:small GTP-binding protein